MIVSESQIDRDIVDIFDVGLMNFSWSCFELRKTKLIFFVTISLEKLNKHQKNRDLIDRERFVISEFESNKTIVLY